MTSGAVITKDTWKTVIKSAFRLFDDLEDKGFGAPPFSLGGGTVLMFRFRHRLSKDIDFFGYDVQWLSLLTPRLNDFAAEMATDYVEQANSVKLVTPHGDIDFVVAADVVQDLERTNETILDRNIPLDPTSEILAKKLFYRAPHFKVRDVYDMSAAIDLDPLSAHIAVFSSRTKSDLLLRRLDAIAGANEADLLEGIVPFDDVLRHSENMIEKVRRFVSAERNDHHLSKYLNFVPGGRVSRDNSGNAP